MKKRIVISINPQHVKNIISGIKKYEYRKIAAKQDVSSIIIYETSPIKRVVAEAEIVEVLMMSPEELWQQTKDSSGITKQFFDKYFDRKEVAYAYKIKDLRIYETPVMLPKGMKAPQDYCYVEEEF